MFLRARAWRPSSTPIQRGETRPSKAHSKGRRASIYVPSAGSVNKARRVCVPAPMWGDRRRPVALVVGSSLFVVLRWTSSAASAATTATPTCCWPSALSARSSSHLTAASCGHRRLRLISCVGSILPSHASGAEMDAIAASIIGGTMLTGGVGNIIGTFSAFCRSARSKIWFLPSVWTKHGGQNITVTSV